MEHIRGFEVVKGYEDKDIHLPVRKTRFSAGYDIEAAEDIVIPKYTLGSGPTLVPTGLKAYMQEDEVLLLYNRSSNPKKKGLVIPNGVGVIDKDYYGNEENDGHFYFAFYNVSLDDVFIKKGEVIGQGIFSKYLLVDHDVQGGTRRGGFGSTDIVVEKL